MEWRNPWLNSEQKHNFKFKLELNPKTVMETYLEGEKLRMERVGGPVEVTLPEFVPSVRKGIYIESD